MKILTTIYKNETAILVDGEARKWCLYIVALPLAENEGDAGGINLGVTVSFVAPGDDPSVLDNLDEFPPLRETLIEDRGVDHGGKHFWIVPAHHEMENWAGEARDLLETPRFARDVWHVLTSLFAWIGLF